MNVGNIEIGPSPSPRYCRSATENHQEFEQRNSTINCGALCSILQNQGKTDLTNLTYDGAPLGYGDQPNILVPLAAAIS